MADNINFYGQVFNRNMLKTDRFFKVPQTLIYSERYQNLSEGAMIVYGFYRDRFDLSEKNNWVDENGDIYFLLSDAEIAYRLGRTEPTIRNKINELIAHGLIRREKRAGATAKTYLYTVDGNARERGYLSKRRLIELLNLMFVEMGTCKMVVRSCELEENFINFVVNQESGVNESEVRELMKLHRFNVLYRIADNHILSISSELLKKVKYLKITTKEKSAKRTEIKKVFKNSFLEAYKILSKDSQITTHEYIIQIEKLWLERNKDIISELTEAERNKIQRNFVSQNFEEKNEIQKNFVSGNKETLYADTKKLFTSQTDFSQTDIIDEEDEKNNKGIPNSENKNWEEAVETKKVELFEKYGEVASSLIKIAEIMTEKNLYDMNHYWDYLYKALQNEELRYQKFTLEPQKQAEKNSFYIPFDGPWNFKQ